jgi:tetratricopeptide (TPR) repeat protein
MVENLQALCKDVDEQDFGWKLRGVLQMEPQVMLLASATSRFQALDDAEEPFFEMFRIIDLKPLTTEDCRRLWQVVSGDTVSGREMRPLEILTGGSPRLLVIIAAFARHKSLRRLMEELVTLIDEHTEYFRGHLEVLAKTERRVYLAVLDLWRLSTPSEIAVRARMNGRTVSTMLGRLVDRGAVIAEGSSRKRQYAAAERLYSIYYKLRRERDEAAIVENLIRFMAVFYSEAEQTEMLPMLISEAAESSAIREGLDRAAAGMPEFDKLLANMRRLSLGEVRPVKVELSSRAILGKPTARAAATVVGPQLVKQLITDISEAFEEEVFEKVIEIVDQTVSSQGAESSQVPEVIAAWALHRKAHAHEALGDLDSAVSAYGEVEERFGASEEPEVRLWVAIALDFKGDTYRELGDLDSAVSAYGEVEERFGASEEPEVRLWVAIALDFKGDTYRELGDLDSAVSAYGEVEERFGASEDPGVQRSIARALDFKGETYRELSDLDSAMSAYGEVEERFGASEDPGVQRWVATALALKGDAHRKLGDLDSAMSAYGEVEERFGASEDPWVQQWVAVAWIRKAETQVSIGRAEDALHTYDEFEPRLNILNSERKSEFIWQATRVRTQALMLQNNLRAAVETFRSMYGVFVPGNETMMREMLELVPDLIVAGVSAYDLIETLSEDDAKAATLAPLLVALKQYKGESVREPAEILEVAADIRKRIQEKMAVRSSEKPGGLSTAIEAD